jgi:hypothetical protein
MIVYFLYILEISGIVKVNLAVPLMFYYIILFGVSHAATQYFVISMHDFVASKFLRSNSYQLE